MGKLKTLQERIDYLATTNNSYLFHIIGINPVCILKSVLKHYKEYTNGNIENGDWIYINPTQFQIDCGIYMTYSTQRTSLKKLEKAGLLESKKIKGRYYIRPTLARIEEVFEEGKAIYMSIPCDSSCPEFPVFV